MPPYSRFAMLARGTRQPRELYASTVSRLRFAAPEAQFKRRRVYECYWAHFAAEIHLSELFEC